MKSAIYHPYSDTLIGEYMCRERCVEFKKSDLSLEAWWSGAVNQTDIAISHQPLVRSCNICSKWHAIDYETGKMFETGSTVF